MSTALPRIDDRQRRARLGRRHRLAGASRSADVVTVAGDLAGLHGSDPASVFLSARARLRRPGGTVAALESALYEERTLIRTLCMRRAMFVVPLDLVPVVQAAVTDALVPGERRRAARMVEDAGIAADGAEWLAAMEAETLAELAARQEATGAELSSAVAGLNHQVPVGEGKTWAGTVGMTSRVLFLLATEQRIVRGRPKGSWTSSQYRWSPIEAWIPGGVPALPAEAARAELARRYLAAYGPATTADLKWWTGWTLGQARSALAAVGAVEVALTGEAASPGRRLGGQGGAGGRRDTAAAASPASAGGAAASPASAAGAADDTAWVLPDDLEPVPTPRPWVALLPSLDPTTMGWQRREWYLGGHGPALFDRNGNAGPSVWADGRIIGGWAQRRTGEVVFDLLEDAGSETAAAVAEAAGELETWLGSMRITPRFPTPLQRSLAD